MALSDNLQYLRKRHKLTQEELADELGVSRQSVSKWETGEAYPETDKIIAICDKFSVTMDDFVRGDLCYENYSDEEMEQSTCDECSLEQTGKKIFEDVFKDELSNEDKEQMEEFASHKEENKRLAIIGTSVGTAIMLACTVAYVLIGCLAHIWHPSWIIFLCGIVANVWVGAFTEPHERMENKTLFQRCAGAICGSAMMCSVIAYLLMGFLAGLWHPGWVVFIGGIAICSLVGGLNSASHKRHNKDK